MSGFIQSFFSKVSNRIYSHLTLNSVEYGNFYPPIYNLAVPLDKNQPELYNKEGQAMKLFFLRDYHSSHDPYFFRSKYFLMDRYNFGLETHFYTHQTMLQQMGKPSKKYGILYETPQICPRDYNIFEKHKGLEKDFDAVFSYSSKILNSLPNAKFMPFQARPWYGSQAWGGQVDPERYKKKTKGISFLSSAKVMCPLHKVRLDLANKCKADKLAHTFGTFDGGKPAALADVLDDYRYTIILENDIDDYYFSERLTNCFLSMTVPVYCGAKKISDFFNQDGIISLPLEKIDDIESVLSVCSAQDYQARIPAILDNFNRVQKYVNLFDWMFTEYLQ